MLNSYFSLIILLIILYEEHTEKDKVIIQFVPSDCRFKNYEAHLNLLIFNEIFFVCVCSSLYLHHNKVDCMASAFKNYVKS